MNRKMTTNSQLSTPEPQNKNKTKTKTSQANNWNRNRITEMEITWRDISQKAEGEKWGKRYTQ